ncbi:MAG: PD40 domain-containing protein [Gemmatimonadetes bacterium]|nr:PD40 domain-containing protein [Gemmatimonadota bacterium]
MMRVTSGSRRRLAALGAALALAAAGCGTETAGPEPGGTASLVAFVGQEGNQPALYVQAADGTQRRRIHFDGAEDPIPGNFTDLPRLEDANIRALGPVSWSPDGKRLAVVVTLAYDQSEVVVVNADGTGARVASPNTQIILTNVDWSPDGRKLAYGMSTIPEAGGVDVFVTDLETNRVQRLTQGANVGGGHVRFDAAGLGVFYAKSVGERETPVRDRLSRIARVELGSLDARTVADSVPGTVEGIARTGAWAMLLRNETAGSGQDEVRQLVREPLAGTAPSILLARGYLVFARLSADDRWALVVSDADPSSAQTVQVSSVIPAQGGQPQRLEGVDEDVVSVDVFYR